MKWSFDPRPWKERQKAKQRDISRDIASLRLNKFEEAMAGRPKRGKIILNTILFSSIAFFVLFIVAVSVGWI